MYKVLLLIGGNEGDRIENIFQTKELIEKKIGVIIKQSGIYESEPWGFEHAQNFLNQVIEIESNKDPFEILKTSQEIERILGRKAKITIGYEGRTMDIDILFYGSEIINTEKLTIPHPRLHERKFTLLPLVEKWENLLHPIFNLNAKDLLRDCKDAGWVKKYE